MALSKAMQGSAMQRNAHAKSESAKLKSLASQRQAAATAKDKGKDKGKDKQIKYGSKEYRNLSVSQKRGS